MTLTEAIRKLEWPDGNIDCSGDEVIEALKPFEARIAQLETALRGIAAFDDEDNEWDGVDKFRDCRQIARNALGSSVETTAGIAEFNARMDAIESAKENNEKQP